MAFPVLAAVGAYASVLGIIDFFVAREEARDTTDRLQEIDRDLSDLRDDIGGITNAILQEGVGKIEAAENALENFKILDDADRDLRRERREEIADLADEGLQQVIAQAHAVIGGSPSANVVQNTLAIVQFALLKRMQIAVEVEAGQIGSAGIRDSIEDVRSITSQGYTKLSQAIYDEMSVDQKTTLIATGFFPGTREVTVESGFTSTSRSGEYEFGLFESSQSQNAKANALASTLADQVHAVDFDRLGGNALEQVFDDLYRLSAGLDQFGDGDDDELFGAGIWEGSGNDPNAILASDFLVGLAGDDTLRANWGNDNVRGDSGDDYLEGDRGNDFLVGGEGDDTIDGGPDFDTARYLGLEQEYTIEGGARSAQVTGPEGTDLLYNVESIFFDDTEILLEDLAFYNAQQVVAFLYGCAFDREPDLPGLNYWIDQFEAGLSVFEIAFFMATEEGGEFERLYGPLDLLTNESYVTLLYVNTLDRVPEGNGFDFWVESLEAGLPRSDAVFYFSESLEYRNNNDALISTLREVEEGEWAFV
ncbi:MAG: DUF4214 domain-containing protein [Pseudomonadota bacterium]